jgi:hypothetical protein
MQLMELLARRPRRRHHHRRQRSNNDWMNLLPLFSNLGGVNQVREKECDCKMNCPVRDNCGHCGAAAHDCCCGPPPPAPCGPPCAPVGVAPMVGLPMLTATYPYPVSRVLLHVA